MPIEKDILGITNSWFKEGFQNKKEIKLPGTDINIFIFTLPFFLASKIEAYNGRGLKGDPRESQDLEDIAQMLDGNTNFESEYNEGSESVKLFIRDNFKNWLEEWDIYSEAIGGFLAYESKEVRIERIKNILNKIMD